MKKELIIENFKNEVKNYYQSGDISYIHIFDISGAPPSLNGLVKLLEKAIDDAKDNKTTSESNGKINSKLNNIIFHR